MKPFFGTFLAGSLLVSGVIFWADPASRWHSRSGFPPRALRRGEIWMWPKDNIDEGRARLAQIQHMDRPDILLLGSSRMLRMNSGMFHDSETLFNAGLAVASLDEMASLWQAVKDARKVPRYAVIGLDPWMLSVHGHVSVHGMDDKYLERFQAAVHSSSHSLWTFSLLRAAMTVRNELAQAHLLLSWTALRTSLRYLSRPEILRPVENEQVFFETQFPPHRFGYRWDGALHYPSLTGISVEDIRRLALLDSANRASSLLFAWEINPESEERLNQLLQDMHDHQVTVALLVMPLHPLTLNQLRKTTPTLWRDLHRVIGRLAVSRGPFLWCDASDGSASGCREADFLDGTHSNDSCVENVLRHCFGQSELWKGLLREAKEQTEGPISVRINEVAKQ